MVGPYEESTPEYRERETATMRAAILGAIQLPNDPSAARALGAIQLPNDPSAARAAYLGHCYLHRGSDSRDLESLLKRDRKHPAYRKTLTILLPEMRRAGVAIPERLQRWEHEHERVTGRWRQEATQKYRIGLVVEAMATGSNVLVLCGEKGKDVEAAASGLAEQCTNNSAENRSGSSAPGMLPSGCKTSSVATRSGTIMPSRFQMVSSGP